MSELALWCDEILPRVRSLSDELSRVYSEELNLPHYRFLAFHLERRYRDLALAQAAFLHGVATHHLHQVCGLVGDDVLAILEEREKLRALNREDLDVDEPLLANVLQSLRKARSIVLFVLEQVHHLDPTGAIARWSVKFQRAPEPLPLDQAVGPLYKHGYDRKNLANFSRNVVAPTARFFGLWRERNVVEDAALLYFLPERFEALQAFAIRESGPDGDCRKLVHIAEEILKDLIESGSVESVQWEWRHIGSLHRELPTKDWRKLLYRAGSVTVICRENEDCYRALYRLHASRYRYRPTEWRDMLGEGTPSGYRALHTTLTMPKGAEIAAEAIPVRLIPHEAGRARRSRFDRRSLENLKGRLKPEGGIDLRVFTPDGRGVVLPVGATVLDFALALNRSWIARLAGATVNRQPVDILHQLRPRDVVWLNLSDLPRPLPHGWEKRINEKRVPKIRKEFKAYYRPALETAGRIWLEQALLERGVAAPTDPDQLGVLLEEAVRTLRHFHERQPSRRLFLQLGLVAGLEKGEELPFRLQIDPPLAQRIVQAVEEAIRTASLVTLHELEIPNFLKLQLQEVLRCTSCEPLLDGPLVGTVQGGRTLILHVTGSPCAAGGVPVSRSRLTARPQYLVLGVTNRIGIAAEVLAVLQKYQVNVLDLAGCGPASGWGVIRVQLDYTGTWRLQEILRDLRRIEGVRKIVKPDEPGVQALEAVLPARQFVQASSWSLQMPYMCGESITDDAYFYGMQEEKATLRRAFDETTRKMARGGRMVFVHGPRRVGKTSLVHCFLRELERSSPIPCLTLYREATPGLSWSEMESLFTSDLARRLRDGAERNGISLPSLAGLTFFELAELARHRLDTCIVLAIDEAVGLLAHCAGEIDAVLAFRSRVQNQPGLLVLWVGPEEDFLRLPKELHNVLQRAESLKVESLLPEEVGALLRAEKLGVKHRIEVPEAVARSIYQMTQGNPYWTSFLGREMWGLARRKSRGVVRYDPQILRMAKGRIFERHRISFVDRLASDDLPGELAGQTLAFLAKLERRASGELGACDLQALHSELASTRPDLEREVLKSVLSELKARGSVVEEFNPSGSTWKISAPILAEYIRYRNAA